jgi:N-acetyl-gamma-glutamyl-phosphate reductase
MIKAGIIGSSGYVAGELIRTLVNHPEVDIDFMYSHTQPGQKVADTHQDLAGTENLVFTDKVNPNADVVFLCLGHGNSTKFLRQHSFSANTKIIDLSSDFRLTSDANFTGKAFVYGLVELNKNKIKSSSYVANPGCFATAIQLGLLPLAKYKLLNDDVHVHAITGATGAGQSLTETTHFSWRNNNVSVYKAFKHQHLDEINESLSTLQAEYNGNLNFLPVRGDYTRGIFATMYCKSELSEAELIQRYEEYYQDEPFTIISKNTINLKQVVNTNNCFIQVQKIDDKVLVTSVIDNLLKGAAGQAIQNMILMFGLEETTGLKLKANYF